MSRLHSADKAIPFTLPDYQGDLIDLNNYSGKRILLSFFRGASCPFCNMRVHELIKRHAEFANKQITILGLFASSAEEIRKYAGQQDPPFPIIPDPSLSIYLKYGVETSHLGMLKAMAKPLKMWKVMTGGFFNMNAVADKPLIPADFLIDETQTIKTAYYGSDFGDHLPIDEILAWH